MHYFKKTLLAAAMAAFSLTVAFPAFADEPVGTDVTVVEAGASDTSEDSSQEIKETSASRESKGRRAAVMNEEEYIAQGPGAQKEEKEEAPAPRRHHLDALPLQDTVAANSAPAVIILPFQVRFPLQTTLFPLI